MRILQVCNVGRIVGGTAACAWSLMRAFPAAEHHVAFLSTITDETRTVFSSAAVHQCDAITDSFVRDVNADCVILHNTAPRRCERITSAWTLQYVHSRGARAVADHTVYCSKWLARECGADGANVLVQCVPRPIALQRRPRDAELVVGRLCTPTAAKWPADLIGFYRALTARHPAVNWEFVGCPERLRPALQEACGGRALFHPAGWEARSFLTRWDALLYHHPTLTESFGRTVAEAMRAGCIPIVDRRGGFCEQVTGPAGFLCGSVSEFSDALRQISLRDTRKRISREAALHSNANFSMAAFRRRLLTLWRSSGAGRKTGVLRQ